jgi:hypothetical protein
VDREDQEQRKRRGWDWRRYEGTRSCRALSVSANSSALPNSMHVLMKHCWPAAHCQCHCRVDDWSIEDPLRFCARPNLPPPTPIPSPNLSCREAERSASCTALLEKLQNATCRSRLSSRVLENRGLNVSWIIRPAKLVQRD